ncbi:MAG TPA: HAD-IB family phosphatase [Myxococcales bacterium]|jgi:2,3-diketo-5-methylthio-1-phosphopentane phosphatase|nr:HAD-IB family phosphatase [Myxococcales bacterium]
MPNDARATRRSPPASPADRQIDAPVPVGVVCDFDGTATLLDVGDEISKHFGGVAHWERESARFRRGELDTRGIIQAIYTRVFASEAEVCAFAAKTARLRSGFAELVAACRDRRAPFVLASGGLRQYIDAVLAAHLAADLRAHVQVVANEGVFSPRGMQVRFPTEEAARELGCTQCGSCKRVAVAEARKRGARHVIGIGDGFADRCLARCADSLWAREGSYLERWCLESAVPHAAFTTLDPVAREVAKFPAM